MGESVFLQLIMSNMFKLIILSLAAASLAAPQGKEEMPVVQQALEFLGRDVPSQNENLPERQGRGFQVINVKREADQPSYRVKRNAQAPGPVYTFVKTDPQANFKWGVRHRAGEQYGKRDASRPGVKDYDSSHVFLSY